jgi:hypothetical protein
VIANAPFFVFSTSSAYVPNKAAGSAEDASVLLTLIAECSTLICLGPPAARGSLWLLFFETGFRARCMLTTKETFADLKRKPCECKTPFPD